MVNNCLDGVMEKENTPGPKARATKAARLRTKRTQLHASFWGAVVQAYWQRVLVPGPNGANHGPCSPVDDANLKKLRGVFRSEH